MVHGLRFYFVVAFLWASLSAHAAEMELADYDELAAILSYTEDFEYLEFPRRFRNLPKVTRFHAAEYGSHFVGQVVAEWHTASGTFDQLLGNPDATMSVASGGRLENVLLEYYTRLDKVLLSGAGPDRYPNKSARGEGSIAVKFDVDQFAFGFRYDAHRDGKTSFVSVRAFSRDGRFVSSRTVMLDPNGALAFRRKGDVRDIAGFTITNVDPGGIAIDDLIYDDQALVSSILGGAKSLQGFGQGFAKP